MSKNLKLKRVIKSFVLEPKESLQVFRVFSDSYMFMNICERFPYLYEYVYFTYSYLGRIFGRIYITYIHHSIKKRLIYFVFILC